MPQVTLIKAARVAGVWHSVGAVLDVDYPTLLDLQRAGVVASPDQPGGVSPVPPSGGGVTSAAELSVTAPTGYAATTQAELNQALADAIAGAGGGVTSFIALDDTATALGTIGQMAVVVDDAGTPVLGFANVPASGAQTADQLGVTPLTGYAATTQAELNQALADAVSGAGGGVTSFTALDDTATALGTIGQMAVVVDDAGTPVLGFANVPASGAQTAGELVVTPPTGYSAIDQAGLNAEFATRIAGDYTNVTLDISAGAQSYTLDPAKDGAVITLSGAPALGEALPNALTIVRGTWAGALVGQNDDVIFTRSPGAKFKLIKDTHLNDWRLINGN